MVVAVGGEGMIRLKQRNPTVIADVALETRCEQCVGTGRKLRTEGGVSVMTRYNCDHCHGMGLILSEKGRKVLNFIDRWSK